MVRQEESTAKLRSQLADAKIESSELRARLSNVKGVLALLEGHMQVRQLKAARWSHAHDQHRNEARRVRARLCRHAQSIFGTVLGDSALGFRPIDEGCAGRQPR
jgi:hypothetical protein